MTTLEQKPLILLVDDDEVYRTRLARAFVDRGYDVRTAGDYDAAVAAASGDSPEYAVVDLKMPGKSGLELLRLIKEKNPHTRVLVVSSMDTPAMSAHLDVEGAHGFIAKPFHPLDVQTAVSGAFEAYQEATHG